jgi:uncharacterized protein with von Willebrand factor type A (vWA) domain
VLTRFLQHLRSFSLPVSLGEWLDLMAALRIGLVFADLERFYFLCRLCLVKDEKYFDRFDRAFAAYFDELDNWQAALQTPAIEEALWALLPETIRDSAAGDWQGLPDDLNCQDHNVVVERLSDAESSGDARDERHDRLSDADYEGAGEGEGEGEGEGQGGEGEGELGLSGFGHGEQPASGIRDDSDAASMGSALKTWQLRQYKDYDPDAELGTRNMKMALRRLRKFARTATDVELDLKDTIHATANNGGFLLIKEVPERRNSVRVLLLLDVGGSMDEHVERCAQLFTAARSEFKYLQSFYFHNCIYESLWHDNARRKEDRIKTLDVLRKFGADYKIIIVGDASMGRQEVAEKGGSVEHYNAESGDVWLDRLQQRFRKVIWLNPVAPRQWRDSQSTMLIESLMDKEMYHLSVEGIEQAMKSLVR